MKRKKKKSIILLSPVKMSSQLNQERNMHKSSTVYQKNSPKQSRSNSLKLKHLNDGFVSNSQLFASQDINWWTGDVPESEAFKVKCLKDSFVLNMQLFSSQDVNWWTGDVWITWGLLWCFYQLFGLSFWRHPFTAEDPLMSKWCDATFLQICSDEKTNSSTSWMAWGWVNFQQNLIFGWTIPLILYFLNT